MPSSGSGIKELAPRCFDDLERATLSKLVLELPVATGGSSDVASWPTGSLQLEVEQDVLAGGISGAVYDASIYLAHYLTAGEGLRRELQGPGFARRNACSSPESPSLSNMSTIGVEEIQGQAVVELGCGAGLPGLAAAALGARTLLTDRSPVAVELAKRNIERG